MKTAATMACACALALAFAPHPANADLLYWMVESPTESWTAPDTPVYFTYATVSTVEGGRLHAYDSGGDTGAGALLALDRDGENNLGTMTGAAYFGSFEYAPSLNFLVELWNAEGERVGWQSYRASSIADSIWKDDGNSVPSSGAAVLKVTDVVPEPTSGMLVLLGLAGLALRRRRAV